MTSTLDRMSADPPLLVILTGRVSPGLSSGSPRPNFSGFGATANAGVSVVVVDHAPRTVIVVVLGLSSPLTVTVPLRGPVLPGVKVNVSWHVSVTCRIWPGSAQVAPVTLKSPGLVPPTVASASWYGP